MEQKDILQTGIKIAHCTLNPFRPAPYYLYNGSVYWLRGKGCINQGEIATFLNNVITGQLRFIELDKVKIAEYDPSLHRLLS